ncbi:MAG TPA: hypothetical protein VE404_10425 [Verrucomicrobiae bacterium]|nr:hypothetical protein [Verrucomicrobiae bacterium]
MSKKPALLVAATLVFAAIAPALAADSDAAGQSGITGITAVYQKVADSILADHDAEAQIVRALLAVERDLALASLGRGDLKTAASRIGDFATEGGAAVEPIRSRLLKGGHHHHADDSGPQAIYDEGYVVLTKKLKVEALDLGKRCAKAAAAPKADPVEVKAITDALTSFASRALAAK